VSWAHGLLQHVLQLSHCCMPLFHNTPNSFFLEKCTDKLCPTMLRKELTIRRAISFDTMNYSAACNQLQDDFGCGYKTSWMPETCIRSNQQLDSWA
jgi:hypothetical protein